MLVARLQTYAEMRRLTDGLESVNNRVGLGAFPEADEIHQSLDSTPVLVSNSIASAIAGCAFQPPTLRLSLEECLGEKTRLFSVFRLEHDVAESIHGLR